MSAGRTGARGLPQNSPLAPWLWGRFECCIWTLKCVRFLTGVKGDEKKAKTGGVKKGLQ